MSQDASVFNDCNLTYVKLYLSSEFYPYDDLNVHLAKIYILAKTDTPSCLICMRVFIKITYDCYDTLFTVSSFLSNSH